jgi:hypothetical protein
MHVFRQGDLDGLCGVYSIVNAARVVARLGPEESAQLFERLVRQVGTAARVAKGVGRGLMDRLLREAAGDVLTCRTPFRRARQVPLQLFWSEVGSFLAQPPGRAGAVILCLDTPGWSHWTTVVALTERQARLVDSDGRRALDRRRCTTGRMTAARPYAIRPTYTYFLS